MSQDAADGTSSDPRQEMAAQSPLQQASATKWRFDPAPDWGYCAVARGTARAVNWCRWVCARVQWRWRARQVEARLKRSTSWLTLSALFKPLKAAATVNGSPAFTASTALARLTVSTRSLLALASLRQGSFLLFRQRTQGMLLGIGHRCSSSFSPLSLVFPFSISLLTA
jgi:hypothetical protein